MQRRSRWSHSKRRKGRADRRHGDETPRQVSRQGSSTVDTAAERAHLSPHDLQPGSAGSTRQINGRDPDQKSEPVVASPPTRCAPCTAKEPADGSEGATNRWARFLGAIGRVCDAIPGIEEITHIPGAFLGGAIFVAGMVFVVARTVASAQWRKRIWCGLGIATSLAVVVLVVVAVAVRRGPHLQTPTLPKRPAVAAAASGMSTTRLPGEVVQQIRGTLRVG